mmetsp:Transcript_96852/g.312750  ORF Transcript_96852/g.312750 Transcript_96852/m.312750 type:complete len:140 (-) Transcript_96852:54-473(-)
MGTLCSHDARPGGTGPQSPDIACRSCRGTGFDVFGKPCACPLGKHATPPGAEEAVEAPMRAPVVCQTCRGKGLDPFGLPCACPLGCKVAADRAEEASVATEEEWQDEAAEAAKLPSCAMEELRARTAMAEAAKAIERRR